MFFMVSHSSKFLCINNIVTIKNNLKQKKEHSEKQVKSVVRQKTINNFFVWASLVIVFGIMIIYSKSLGNQLTNLDDDFYITNNADITNLNIKYIFSSYVQGNYHPLTMLSYCIEYKYAQLDPKIYHITNLVLHIFNSLLVFTFIWLLSKQRWVAFITALLFAIHPMHVESVAWVSERKDVLYSFFYLGGLCSYLLYIKTDIKTEQHRRVLLYGITLFLFVLALLSKGMAVSFSLILFAIDYFLERKITSKTILEKSPFLLLSCIFGYIAIQAQQLGNAIHVDSYVFTDRFLFSCYGLMMYLWKFFVPIHLSCYYNYPTKLDGVFPNIIYVAPIIIMGLIFLVYRSLKFGKDIVFGVLFFLIAIILVLQILPVGGAIISDRYTYLPYIGLSFVLARLINHLLETKSEKWLRLKIPFIISLSVFCIICGYLAFQQSKVWRDSTTLWNNAINNERFNVAYFALGNRAVAYFNAGQYEKAVIDYNRYIKIKNDESSTYCNRGMAYYFLHKYEEAITDFDSAIRLDAQNSRAYHFRSLTYFNLQKYNEAIADVNTLLTRNTDIPEDYYIKGSSYLNLGKYQEAIADLTKAINSNPNYFDAYNNRGLAYYQLYKFNEALTDYTYSIKHNQSGYNAYFNRALVYDALQKYNEAIVDYTMTIQLLPNYAQTYYKRSLSYFNSKQYNLAYKDVVKAEQLGYLLDKKYINDIQAKIK